MILTLVHFMNFTQTFQGTSDRKMTRITADSPLMLPPIQRSYAPNSTSGSFWFSYADALPIYIGQSLYYGGVTMLSDTLATILYTDGQGRPQFFSFAQTFDFESNTWNTFYDGYIDDNGNEIHIPDLNSVNTYTIDSVSCTYAYSRGTNVASSVVDTLIISIAAIDSINYTQINLSGNPWFRQPDVPYNIQQSCIVGDTFPKYQIKKIPLRIQDTTGNFYFNRYIPITGFSNISEKKVIVSMAFKPGNSHTVSSVIGVNVNKFLGYYNEDPRSEFNTPGSTQLLTDPNVSLNAMEYSISDPQFFLYGKYVSNSVWNGELKRPGIGVHVTCNNCVSNPSLTVSPTNLNFTNLNNTHNFIVSGQDLSNPTTISCPNSNFVITPTTIYGANPYTTVSVTFIGNVATSGTITISSGNLTKYISLSATIIPQSSLIVNPDTLHFTDQVIVNSFTITGQNLTDPVTITSYNNNFIASPTTLTSSSMSEVITVVFIGNQSTNGIIKVQSGDTIRFVHVQAVVTPPQLPNPYFVPAGGVYPIGIPMNVAVLCDSNDVEIYYTSDGTIPSNGDMEYNSPILLNLGNTTLKAIAYKSGFLPSEVVTSVYDIIDEINESILDGILIYPNPTYDYFTLDCGKWNVEKIELFTIGGQLLFSDISQNSTYVVDLNPYAQGIYFLKITTDKSNIIRKVMKM